jgi:hypothetical protein
VILRPCTFPGARAQWPARRHPLIAQGFTSRTGTDLTRFHQSGRPGAESRSQVMTALAVDAPRAGTPPPPCRAIPDGYRPGNRPGSPDGSA